MSKRIELLEKRLSALENIKSDIVILDNKPYVIITVNAISKLFQQLQIQRFHHKSLPASFVYNDINFIELMSRDQIHTLIKNFTLIELRELLLECMAHILIPSQKIIPFEDSYTRNIENAINMIADTIKISLK